MSISTLVAIAGKGKSPAAAKDAKPKTARQKKADRPFAPEDSNIRPSEYQLARRLIWLFSKVRNDEEYGRRFDEMVLAEKEKAIRDARSLQAWRERQTEPAPIKVRASELKDCSRKVGLRLLGFTPSPTPAKYGNWNVSAMTGSDLHLLVQTALKFLGVIKRDVRIPGYEKPRFGAEFNVKTEANDFGGRVDVLLDGSWFTAENDWSDEDEPGIGQFLTADGHLEDAVLDIKTVGPEDFAEGAWGRKTQGYIAQVSAYARLLGVKKGVILLVDRGSGKMLDYAWDIDEEYADTELARASHIVELVKARKLPEAEDWDTENDKMSGTCFLFCAYRDYCQAQQRDGSTQRMLDAGLDVKDISEELRWKPGS